MNYPKYFFIFIINFLVAILILCKLTQVALRWVDIYTKHGYSVVVPDLRGLTLPESISILKKLGLKYDVDTSHYNPSFKINQIISSSPEPGNHVKEGRHIYIQVNSQSYQSFLPDIINKDKRIAIKLLHANHIFVKEIRYVHNMSKDTVLKVLYKNQSIRFGYKLPTNQDGITLIIGKGYERNNLVVPNVVGMSLHSAIDTLKNQLFHVINFYYDHGIINPYQNAQVYRQKPDPGEIYDKNKSIELWLTSKELLDNLIQVEEKDSKKQIEKIQVEEKDSKKQIEKIQIEEKNSKNKEEKIESDLSE
ncbi:PASTA domain-containing protein [Blattabacterium cuenoti]|uniref:PASTA domain-containing protein n=1 Tax=Blattabacterium cuenoti TaxID=1653831 RepID=UPI00163BF4B6|nr:PASTA domain-containing protein [Blattabacterium cuenoti]